MLHKDFLDRVDVGFAWGLVESFATQPREAPEDANRGAELIAERLKSAGIPVTMHRPTLFLSLPGPASVDVTDGRTTIRFALPRQGVSLLVLEW